MKSINLEIPSLPDNVRIVESFIDNSKEKFKFNDDIYGNVMIAITEAVNNAIQHGNKNDKNKNVLLSMEYKEDRLKFTVEDQGNGFDFTDVPDPTAPGNIEQTNGRGIFLMKTLADEVRFLEDGRIAQLTFYLE